jgi:ParB family chromosome partitioning protein
MRKPKPDAEYDLVAIANIDPPPLPMRQGFDQAKMEDLIESVRRFGVLLPIRLRRNGHRYEIEDGHRRYTAALAAGLDTIPAVIRSTTAIPGEAIKVQANLHREDVNPADRAVYFAEVLTQHCHDDIDELCKLTGLKRAYVEERLTLILGDQVVFRALAQGAISLAVARELNKVEDPGYRAMYLDAAVRGGASARLVIEWRQQSAAIPPTAPPQAGDGQNQFTTLPPPVTTMTCICCESDARPWEMEFVPMHRQCRAMFIDAALARVRAALGDALRGVHADGERRTNTPTP